MQTQPQFVYIDNLVTLFKSTKILFNDLYQNSVSFNSVEEEFYVISGRLSQFFSKREISYEEKYNLFKDISISSNITIHKELTDIQSRIINYLRSLNYPVFDAEVQNRKNDAKLLDDYLRKVFTAYMTVMSNMRKTDSNSIDDLLGMTDCNGKKEREYWIENIIRELKNTKECGLLEIMEYLGWNKKELDFEIDLSQIALKQLREIYRIIKTNSN